jgi:hypothetical protein
MKHMDILVQWKFLRRDEFEENGNCSSDNMELGKKHVLVITHKLINRYILMQHNSSSIRNWNYCAAIKCPVTTLWHCLG